MREKAWQFFETFQSNQAQIWLEAKYIIEIKSNWTVFDESY